jgi:hypothetical protein
MVCSRLRASFAVLRDTPSAAGRLRSQPGAGEQGVGAVDLVAGSAEVLPDRAEIGAAGDAVLHQPGGLGPVRVGGGAGVDAQLGLQRVADGPGADEADQAAGEDRRLRPGRQADGQPPGGDMVDGAAPGVGSGDAIVDQPLVQLQIRELALLDARAGVHLIRWLADPVATCGGRCRGTRPGHRAINAVRLSRRSSGGCPARPAGGIRLPWGLGAGHRVAASGSDAGELRQVLAGDQLPSADLEMGQIAKAHLLMEQAAGWTAQAGGLIDGKGQLTVRVRACTANGACGDDVSGRRI